MINQLPSASAASGGEHQQEGRHGPCPYSGSSPGDRGGLEAEDWLKAEQGEQQDKCWGQGRWLLGLGQEPGGDDSSGQAPAPVADLCKGHA